MNKTVLLASFVRKKDIDKSLNMLKNKEILNEKVFVLKDASDEDKFILTYNIMIEEGSRIDFDYYIKGTISLHRKRETNTLYTLNSLNQLIILENNGVLDKSFPIDWEKYKNCMLIISNNNNLTKIKTVLESIEDLNKE